MQRAGTIAKTTPVLATVLWLLSLPVAAVALVLADFGAPVWVFVLLLAWLLTVGLPTLCGILLVASFWDAASVTGFLVSVAVVSLAFQCLAVFAVRRVPGIFRGREVK